MSRKTTKWKKLIRQADGSTERIIPGANVKGEGRMRRWNNKDGHHMPDSGTPSQGIGTRPMGPEKMGRIEALAEEIK